MNYKYKRNQIFGKKLKVPKYILNKVYDCTLSLSDFIKYGLDDKIPISCIIESDRQIVEKFGIDRCKELDWELIELINKRVYYNSNINFRNVLMSIDSQVQDINSALYELVKDEIKPVYYTPKMREVYSDRLFDVSQNNDENLRYIINNFNKGIIGLKEIIYNWDLFKNKDLSYCLLNDNANKNHITDNMLKEFMSSYGALASLIAENNDIYEFISTISTFISEEEKKNYIKQFTDDILSRSKHDYSRPSIKLTNDQYKEIFKYSSIEDYLNLNAYGRILEELQELPEDYLFTMSIPFSELLNHNVLSFVNIYGLKNVVDFDNECGHFFTKNNCEMLELIYVMYINYGGIIFRSDENGNYIDRPYTKDEFYGVMKKVIIYGPTDSVDDTPDYREMTGEFRNRNPELFISKQAPEELQKLFYTKSITPKLFLEHPEYISYLNGKDLSSCLKKILIQVEVSDSLIVGENFYKFLDSKTDFNVFMNFIKEYSDVFDIVFGGFITKDGVYNRADAVKYGIIFSMEDSFDEIKKRIND
ncbi:MAG: hypothetical protein ACI4WU_01230, partial [Bacilli bacterium]